MAPPSFASNIPVTLEAPSEDEQERLTALEMMAQDYARRREDATDAPAPSAAAEQQPLEEDNGGRTEPRPSTTIPAPSAPARPAANERDTEDGDMDDRGPDRHHDKRLDDLHHVVHSVHALQLQELFNVYKRLEQTIASMPMPKQADIKRGRYQLHQPESPEPARYNIGTPTLPGHRGDDTGDASASTEAPGVLKYEVKRW